MHAPSGFSMNTMNESADLLTSTKPRIKPTAYTGGGQKAPTGKQLSTSEAKLSKPNLSYHAIFIIIIIIFFYYYYYYYYYAEVAHEIKAHKNSTQDTAKPGIIVSLSKTLCLIKIQ